MNWSAPIGAALALCAVVFTIVVSAPLFIFIDLPSIVLIVVGTPCLLLLSYGGPTLRTHGIGGMTGWLVPSTTADWTRADHRKAVRIAHTAGILAILLGMTCGFLGCIQMLQSLDDPSQLGPALAVAQLTTFYAVLLTACFFIPIARHHAAAADEAGGEVLAPIDPDSPLWNAVFILGLVSLTIGLLFIFILLSMASW